MREENERETGPGPTPYQARFELQTSVRIRPREELQRFARQWAHHNKPSEKHFAYAGRIARVANVGFYHGGDPLYGLEGVPALLWLEQCLTAAD